MNHRAFFAALAGVALCHLAPMATAQSTLETAVTTELDSSELNRQLLEREQKLQKLTPEEREAVRLAREKAMKDPAVQAAVKKRDEALRAFNAAVVEGLVKADPTVRPLLQKMNSGAARGY